MCVSPADHSQLRSGLNQRLLFLEFSKEINVEFDTQLFLFTEQLSVPLPVTDCIIAREANL